MANQPLHTLVPLPLRTIPKPGRRRFSGTITVAADPAFTAILETASVLFIGAGILLKPGTAPALLTLARETLEGRDAYRISITPDSVTLFAMDADGMFHATQTLLQLVLSEEGSLPCMEVEDRSAFPWRGCMLDCSRHFHTVSFIKHLLDLMALHHLNIFHWHLTDDQGWRFPVPGYPELAEIGAWRIDSRQVQRGKTGGAYTRNEIDDIVRHARERRITIAPEIDLPGHVSALLASLPSFGCTGGPYRVEDRFGIFEEVLCAGNPALEPFLEALFDAVAECFPGPYVHIGGDEVPTARWESCPRCRTAAHDNGLSSPTELQQFFTRRISAHLIRRGKTPVGWDEILDAPEALSPDSIVMSWRGSEGGRRAAASNFRVVMTPLDEGCYLNFRHRDDPDEPGHLDVTTLAQSAAMRVVPAGVPQNSRHLFLGGQGNLWCEVIDSGKLAEYMLFPRLSLLAEAFWTDETVRKDNPVEQRLAGLDARLERLGLCRYRDTTGSGSVQKKWSPGSAEPERPD